MWPDVCRSINQNFTAIIASHMCDWHFVGSLAYQKMCVAFRMAK